VATPESPVEAPNPPVAAAEKAKTLSEDAAKDTKDRIQKLTKKHEDEIDAILAAKGKEIEEG
jgi:ribosome recycling factor